MNKPETFEPAPAPPAFETDVQNALSALQSALGAAVEALPEYPRKAPDLTRLLGLERNVAWKLHRLIHERDVFAAARFVPGAGSIAAFVAGAAGAGVPGDLLERVSETSAKYDAVVRFHAGDRAAADVMLGSRSGEAAELVLRRSAFRSMSFLAGVQARAQLQVFILAPSEKNGQQLDGVSLNGFVDLTRMRSEAPVVIGRAMATDRGGGMLPATEELPIDGPLPEGEHVPLLREFCSTPLPRFVHGPGERGFTENELVSGPVGKTGAISFMAGTLIRGVGNRYRDKTGTTADVVARVRTPVSLLICDILAPEGLLADDAPRVGVYSDLFGHALLRGDSRERYRLRSAPQAELLGMGCGAGQTPEIPRYSRMLQHVFDRVGWDARRFKLFRVRIEYPFTPASVLVTFELREPPMPPGGSVPQSSGA
jgi:hypothetical protein